MYYERFFLVESIILLKPVLMCCYSDFKSVLHITIVRHIFISPIVSSIFALKGADLMVAKYILLTFNIINTKHNYFSTSNDFLHTQNPENSLIIKQHGTEEIPQNIIYLICL